MKHFYSLLMVAALATPAVATADEAPNYRLVKKVDVDYGDSQIYKWDQNNRLVEIEDNQLWEQVFLHKVFTYDAQGRIIRQDMYQSDDGDEEEYVLVNYITYDYDEQGRLWHRYNYNRDPEFPDNPLEYMGMYLYEYGENGKLAERKTYLDSKNIEEADLRQRVSYAYDEQDRLAQVSEVMYFDDQGWVSNGYMLYLYDDRGLLYSCVRMLVDNGQEIGGGWLCYEYDEEGSITGLFWANAAGAKLTSSKLKHSDVPAEQVIYPFSNETDYDRELYGKSHYQITNIEEFLRANEDDELHRSANWEMVYELAPNNMEAIEAVEFDGNRAFTVRVTDGKISLLGIDKADNVQVFDTAGRLVQTIGSTGRTIDVSNLPGGVYVLSTSAGAAKFVR